MKTTFAKQMDGAQAKEPGGFREARSRGSKKRMTLLGSRDIWRALSNASLASPHTSILRLRD
jgi:hypothetical protein